MEKEVTVKEALDSALKKHSNGELQEAEIIYRAILDKYPDNPDALHLLGLIAHQTGNHEEAARLVEKAIEIMPKMAIYYGNLGMVYDSLGNEEESTKNFEKALELNPKYNNAYLAHYNLGVYYKDKGELEKTLMHYDKSIELNSGFADAHFNRGLILLLLGRFEEGWKEYEYRFKKRSPTDSRVFNKPKWDGSNLNGKRIFVLSEQGFGDSIQFIRYIPLIKELNGYVILECRKELKRLFNNLPGVDEIIEKQNGVPNIEFDCYIHLMSLPEIFKTNLENIPKKIPYLKAGKEIAEKFKEKIKNETNEKKFKIGIAWAGNPKQDNDKNRSANIDKFKILETIPDVQIYSLQKGDYSEELKKTEIIDMNNEMDDFADTSGIIENMDLIISVDTSISHLAGAMGKPVWTLLAFIPDWRYLLERNDSPWYKSMRLFRQKKKGDWDSLLNEVIEEIKIH